MPEIIPHRFNEDPAGRNRLTKEKILACGHCNHNSGTFMQAELILETPFTSYTVDFTVTS